jgi:hypothetical protein
MLSPRERRRHDEKLFAGGRVVIHQFADVLRQLGTADVVANGRLWIRLVP